MISLRIIRNMECSNFITINILKKKGKRKGYVTHSPLSAFHNLAVLSAEADKTCFESLLQATE